MFLQTCVNGDVYALCCTGAVSRSVEVKTGYLQSLQEAEVLKGSPLHDADLIVLQMTVAADRERKTHRSMLLNIITKKKKTNNLGAKSAETVEGNSRDQTAGEINERLKCLRSRNSLSPPDRNDSFKHGDKR